MQNVEETIVIKNRHGPCPHGIYDLIIEKNTQIITQRDIELWQDSCNELCCLLPKISPYSLGNYFNFTVCTPTCLPSHPQLLQPVYLGDS